MKHIRKNVLSIVCAFVFVLALGLWSFNILFPLKYKSLIRKYAQDENIGCGFIASIINVESGFESDAVSKKGAVGLMQIMPSTGKWIYEQYFDDEFQDDFLFDPKINIFIGVKYLSYLFEKYDDEVTVLACYNTGETVVQDWIGENKTLKKTQIQFKETEKYVQKVQNLRKIYNKRFW